MIFAVHVPAYDRRALHVFRSALRRSVRKLTGHSFNELIGWERNHFDRLVHFSYGLLLAYPVRELFLRVANVRGFWGYFLPLDLTMSTSMVYELDRVGRSDMVRRRSRRRIPRLAGR